MRKQENISRLILTVNLQKSPRGPRVIVSTFYALKPQAEDIIIAPTHIAPTLLNFAFQHPDQSEGILVNLKNLSKMKKRLLPPLTMIWSGESRDV